MSTPINVNKHKECVKVDDLRCVLCALSLIKKQQKKMYCKT